MIRTTILAALTAGALQAEELVQFDMESLPLAEMNLEGGTFIATLYEESEPFQSMIVFSCPDCAGFTEMIAGVTADIQEQGAEFLPDPNAFVARFAGKCQVMASDCITGTVAVAGLPGFSYAGRFDGTVVIEHNYFHDGLIFHIYSAAPAARTAQNNAEYMRDFLTPYVTGNSR